MKILVLSLLRLGDIIQQEPVLRALKDKYPEARIDLLINKQFGNVEKILKDLVDNYIYFDREAIQQGLGDPSYNILWSYSQVQNLVSQINGEHYDMAYNLTHTKLSAYLLGALQIPQKLGLHQQDGRFQGMNNRWIRYFNERFSGQNVSLFHYVELLGNSFSLPVHPPLKAQKTRSKTVLFQCLTSEQRKNWGLENFKQLKQTLETSLVDYKVKVLGASFERTLLEEFFSEQDLLICDLTEAKKHLQEAALLVTGDTSIKHLAAQIGTPIVELALGHSDPVKTGAYATDAQVLRAVTADEILVDDVFAAAWHHLSGEKQRQQDLIKDFRRAVWKTYLDKENADSDPGYVAVLMDLRDKYDFATQGKVIQELVDQGTLYAGWFDKIKSALPSKEFLASKKSISTHEMADLILCAQDILKSKKDHCGYFQSFVEALLNPYVKPVQLHERISAALTDIAELLDIRENLLQYLQSHSMEGVYYAKGIGQLPIAGFEETRKGPHRNLEDADL